MTAGQSPPRALRRLLAAVLPGRDRATLLGELDELYADRVRAHGRRRAVAWYARQIPSFALRLTFSGLGTRAATNQPGPRGMSSLDVLRGNLRDALRAVRRSPTWAVASILALSFGVAGVSVVFGVANWVLLRPVPGVASPADLVTVLLGSTESEIASWPISHPDFRTLRERSRTASSMAASVEQDVHISLDPAQPAERIFGRVVTSDYFATLGVRLVAGAGFSEGDEVAGAANTVVISDRLWASRWNRSRDALGAEVRVNGALFTVTGIAPRAFHGEELPGRTELWFPAGALPVLLHDAGILDNGMQQLWGTLIVRPVAGASVDDVRDEMNRGRDAIRKERLGQPHSFLFNHALFRAYPGVGLPPEQRPAVRRTLAILGACALFLLLLSCANVANLGLARASAIRPSIGIRRALGASGLRIVLDRVTETALVGLIGGAAGAALAWGATRLLRAGGFALLGVPLDGVELDGRVLALTLSAGLLAGVIAGLAPAIATRRHPLIAPLRSARHGDRRTMRMRAILVAAQVAISAVLLVGAGLFASTLYNLRRVDLGFEVGPVLTFGLNPELQGYDEAGTRTLMSDVVRRLESRSDVESAAIVFAEPFQRLSIPSVLKRPDVEWQATDVMARTFQVSSGFFDAYGLELIAGRNFREDEWALKDAQAARVAILNESAAKKLYPELRPADVVGKTIDSRAVKVPVTVIGIVRDVRLVDVNMPPAPSYFVPWSQGYDVGRFTVAVRTRIDPLRLVSPVRSMLREIDPGLPAERMLTLGERIDELLAEQRLLASLAVTLAALGLMLAAVGLYGVLSYAVSERRREIGIRTALGAMPARVTALILRGGLGVTLGGAVAGLAGAAWLSRFLQSRLFGVERLDPRVYALGAVTLVAVALIACWIPAARALRVDPTIALRDE